MTDHKLYIGWYHQDRYVFEYKVNNKKHMVRYTENPYFSDNLNKWIPAAKPSTWIFYKIFEINTDLEKILYNIHLEASNTSVPAEPTLTTIS